MQDCCEEFEKLLDAECAKGNGYAVVDMFGKTSNLTFVRGRLL
jgi:hypothetical protein